MDQALGSLCADLRRQRPSLQCAAQWNLDDLPGFRTLTEDEMTFGYPQSGWSVHVDLSEKVGEFCAGIGAFGGCVGGVVKIVARFHVDVENLRAQVTI